MSSGQERDVIDYIDDESEHEDETPFVPVRDNSPDNWTAFYTGILIGVAGGALIPLAPWLGGLLILLGYGTTAFTLRARGNRLTRALRSGFWLSATFGAALIVAEALFPKLAWSLVATAGERTIIFPTVVVMPWAAGLLRYAYVLIRF